MAARREILGLYKQLLREAQKFPSYVYRTYARRRIKDYFQEYKGETKVDVIDNAVKLAKTNLEVMKHQVVIGQLFKGQDIVIEQHIKSKELAHDV